MAATITVSEARASLPHVLDRVSSGEEVMITRHGVVVAVMVRPDSLRARRATDALASADRVRDVLDAGANARLSKRPALSEERADELVAEIRADRAAR